MFQTMFMCDPIAFKLAYSLWGLMILLVLKMFWYKILWIQALNMLSYSIIKYQMNYNSSVIIINLIPKPH